MRNNSRYAKGIWNLILFQSPCVAGSLGKTEVRTDCSRLGACRYLFHGHATEPMRRARVWSRINWLSISSMSTFSRSIA